MTIRDYGEEIRVEERAYSIDFIINGEKVNISKGEKIGYITIFFSFFHRFSGSSGSFSVINS